MTLAPQKDEPCSAPVASPAERVDRVLAEFLDRQRVRPLRPLIGTLRDFVLSGGKRIRPSLCYWSWRGSARGGSDERVIRAGAALEMFHCFALIHDDIIDGSDFRRGRPSLNSALGPDVALLCGDLCALWAEDLFHECGPPPMARKLFSTMRVEAIAGEYLDITAGPEVTVARALEVVRWKTTRYSVIRPLQIGAMLAGADAVTVKGYESFGEPLGEAFQLRDDILGVFGDPAVTGKPADDDLRQAKPTVLWALTNERARLDGIAEPEVIRRLMVSTGALADTEERIRAARSAALIALAGLNVTDDARRALATLVELSVSRTN